MPREALDHRQVDDAVSHENQPESARRHLIFRFFEGTNDEDPLEDKDTDKWEDTSGDGGNYDERWSRKTHEDEDPLEDEGIPFFKFEEDSASEDEVNHQAKGTVKDSREENKSCSICGSGYVVTKPKANGINPLDLSVTCEQLDKVAQQGLFTEEQCQMLVDMNCDKCGCEPPLAKHGSTIAMEPAQDRKQIPCSICGKGYAVTNPDADGIDPDDASITCGQIQEMAEDGKFTADECEELVKDADIFRACECQADPHAFNEESDALDEMMHDKDPPPTDEDIPPAKRVACSICSKGFAVTNPDANIDPDQPSLTCGQVQEAAEDGKLTADECDELMHNFRIFTTCGCEMDPFDKWMRDKDPPPTDEDVPPAKTVTCSICGQGFAVTNPDANGIDPDEPSLTCGELQEAAEGGIFTVYECDELMANFRLFAACDCQQDPFYNKSDDPLDELRDNDLPAPPSKACSICGNGYVVSEPDANGIDPDEPSLTCGQLQEAAEDGNFSEDECDELTSDFRLFTTCGCVVDPLNEMIADTDPPPDEHVPLSKPVAACSICGNGYVVSKPDADGIDPDDPSLTCGQVQEAAEDGKFSESECDELTNDFRIFATCGCLMDPLDDVRDNDVPTDKDVPFSKTVSCSICGQGYVVSEPDADGFDPDDPSLTCGDLQDAAEDGKFSEDECIELRNDVRLFNVCGCERDILDETLEDASLEDLDRSPCSVCGTGFVVTNPNVDGIYFGGQSRTCGQVQEAAEDGQFSLEECFDMMNDRDVSAMCGCAPDPAQSRTDHGVDIPLQNSSEETSSLGEEGDAVVNVGGGGGGDCQLSVMVRCVPPKDSAYETCDEYVTPEMSECQSTPRKLKFKFRGGQCDNVEDAPQGANQYLCQDFSGGATVTMEEGNYIEALPTRRMGALYYEGSVHVGDTVILANVQDESGPLDEEILILVYKDGTKKELRQMIIFHTKCNTDLSLGDSYGSLELISFSNDNLKLNSSMKKNVTVQVTITNMGTEDVHMDHAITFLEQTSRDVLGDAEEVVLSASGQEALTLVQEFTFDSLPPRVISLSATISGHDPQMTTCVAFGETSIVIPDNQPQDAT